MTSTVLEQLHREHASIACVLNALERQVRQLERGQTPDYALMSSALEYFLDFPDRCHHPKEDQIFRRLCLRDPAAAPRVGDLPEAHAALAVSVRSFAGYLDDVLRGSIVAREDLVHRARDFIDRQWQHLAMEEATFLPAAEEMLAPEDWSEIEATLPNAADPLSSRDASRFDALRETVLAWEREDDAAKAQAGR